MWKLLLIAAAFAAASPLRPVRSARPATLASARPSLARAEPRAGAAAQDLQLQDPCIDVSDVTMHLEPPPRVPATFIRNSRRLRARGSDDVEEMPVRIADFAALPADLQGVFQVPEIELIGRIKEPAGDADARGDGARVEEARELCKILENELVRMTHVSLRKGITHATRMCSQCALCMHVWTHTWPSHVLPARRHGSWPPPAGTATTLACITP